MGTKYGGRWEIESTVGEGGQKRIRKVRDTTGKLSGQYALKEVKYDDKAKVIDRLEDEVKSLGDVKHKGVEELVDYRIEEGDSYIVTKYYEGGDLADLELGKMSLVDKLRLFEEICDRVGALHDKDIYHRDLKPENILFTEDRKPVVADLGICFVEGDDSTRRTCTGEAVGSVNFIAPEAEQGRVDEVDERLDVYSLGKILYWLISDGDELSRETHKEEDNDLRRAVSKEREQDVRILYSSILDWTIQREPTSRVGNANMLRGRVADVRERVKRDGNYVGLDSLGKCGYCGKGYYTKQVSMLTHSGMGGRATQQHNDMLRIFGEGKFGKVPFIVLACEHCGNLELFKPDKAEGDGVERWRSGEGSDQ